MTSKSDLLIKKSLRWFLFFLPFALMIWIAKLYLDFAIAEIITTGELSKTMDRQKLVFSHRLSKAIESGKNTILLNMIAPDSWAGFSWNQVCRADNYQYVGEPYPDELSGWTLRFSQTGRETGVVFHFDGKVYGDGMPPNASPREWCVERKHAVLYHDISGWVLMDNRQTAQKGETNAR